MTTASQVQAALAEGHKFTRERGIGCGRIYVVVDKEFATVVAAGAKAAGMIFQRKAHYGMKNALYIGYDNCDGGALGQGTATVAALKAIGVGCYREEQGD